jgi:rhodanese-related sulfurtransferase
LAALSGVDVLLVPLSDLSQRGLAALPDEVKDRQTSIAVLCHHGIRSAQVTQWLLAQGWKDVRSVEGGLDLYAQKIDSSVGAYE